MTTGTLRIALLTHSVNPRGAIGFAHAVPALLRRFSRAASARRHLDVRRQWLSTQPLALH